MELLSTVRLTHRAVAIGNDSYCTEQLNTAIDEIRSAISSQIEIDVDSNVHERFVRALHRPMRPGKLNSNQPIDYLVMNYDTLIEDSLALSKIKYSDGIAGGVTGWWEPGTFDAKELEARVFKLHGSINWAEVPGSNIPHRFAAHLRYKNDKSHRKMIWPASTKYRETQLDPYAQLMERARTVLNPTNGSQRVLLISGYSFGDSHINIEIERGLKVSNGNLTVVIFTSEDEPNRELAKWHQDRSISEQVLIFANKGFFHADKQVKSEEAIEWWKFECLTQILEGHV